MNFDQLAGPEPSKLVGQHDSTCPLICMDKMMLSQHNYKTTIKAEIKRYNYHLTTLPLHLYSCLQCMRGRILKRVEKVTLIVKCYRGGGMYERIICFYVEQFYKHAQHDVFQHQETSAKMNNFLRKDIISNNCPSFHIQLLIMHSDLDKNTFRSTCCIKMMLLNDNEYRYFCTFV